MYLTIFKFIPVKKILTLKKGFLVLKAQNKKLKSFGDCAFSSYGPRIWNSLPKRILDIDKLESLKSN